MQLGPLTIRWYGLCIALGFICATYFAGRLAKKFGLSNEHLINCELLSFVGGVIGARLYYVFLCWHYFSQHLLEIAAVWKGGLSIHGGIIGGTIFGALYCYRTKQPILRYADLIAAVIPLGQAIGRWGNFFNSELFGLPVPDNYFIKVYISPENRPPAYYSYSYFHPAFLYESLFDLFLFLLLYLFVVRKLGRYPGVTSLLYIAGYSVGRLLIEPLRVDSIIKHGIQVPIIASAVSLILALLALLLLVCFYARKASQ